MKKIYGGPSRGQALWSTFTGVLALTTFTANQAWAQPEPGDPVAPPDTAPVAPAPLAPAPVAEAPEADAEGAPTEEAPAGEPASDTEESTTPEAPPSPAGEQEAEASGEASASGSLSLGGADAEAEASGDAAESEEEPEPDASGAGGRAFPTFGLERLPPESYPTDPVRGIDGGSLMWTMNGLQWPYMPMRDGASDVRVGFSGYGFVDSSLRDIEAGLDTETDQQEYRQQGRFVLRTTPVFNVDEDWFIQGNIEYVANGDQTRTNTYIDIDDAWIRVGKWDLFDIQVGRMQGWEVYHFGMGLDWATFERVGATSFSNTPIQAYGVTDMWDRAQSTGSLTGHYYPTKWARIELQSRFGTSGPGNDIGVRPVGILDFGFLKLKVGGERRSQTSIFKDSDGSIETQGYGAAAMAVWYPYVEAGGGFGVRVRDQFDTDGGRVAAGSDDTISFGGFANVRIIEDLLLGGGYLRTEWENLNTDPITNSDPDFQEHIQIYGALQYVLWDQLYIKYVFSQAEGYFYERSEGGSPSQEFTNYSTSHRLRFQLFY